MKKVNNKGFTLVELLVCVAVVAALSIAMGVGASNAMNSSNKADYAATFKELFKNANIYAETHNESGCNIHTGTECKVKLETLVGEGLVDENIYKKKNPYLKDGNFNANDVIVVNINRSTGYKSTYYSKGSCSKIYYMSDDKNLDVNSFAKWGECA